MIQKISNKKIAVFLVISALLMSVVGCQGNSSKEVIRIATKPMVEQYILAEMIKAVIEEHSDLEVAITKGVGGGTTNIHPAMLKGEFDIYPEYTRTAWYSVLKKENGKIPDGELLEQLKTEYEVLGLQWVGMYGFSNSYTLAVRAETAKEYNLDSFSDLAGVSGELIFGGNYDYIEKEDGYPLLCSSYGMQFKDTIDMEIGLKYTALEEKQIDVMNAFATDAGLSNEQVFILKDDKQFFDSYLAGTVVRTELIEKYPEIKEALMLLDSKITEQEMAGMNYEVEVNQVQEDKVAKDFLRNKGIIEK